MAGEDNPELKDTLRETGVLERRFWTMVGVVDSYDAETLEATVLPTPRMKDRLSGRAYDLGPVTLPVAWPVMFGGDVVIQGELAKGDEVEISVPDANMLPWFQQGGVVDSAGPGRKLGGGWCKPVGLSTQRRPDGVGGEFVLGRASGDATVVITVTGPGQVRIQAPSVELGAAASPKLPVARDTDPVNTNAAFTAWRSAVEAGILAAGGGVVPPLAGTAIGNVSATSTEVESS
jgi:hypothetical protein